MGEFNDVAVISVYIFFPKVSEKKRPTAQTVNRKKYIFEFDYML